MQDIQGIKDSEKHLHDLKTEFHTFEDSVHRIHVKIVEPYEQIQSCIKEIEEIQETTEYLQLISKILFLNKRLGTVLAGETKDLAEAAQIIADIGM